MSRVAPLKFIENSPVFHADKVNTPLMMIHNDADDAVPWYQGVEYYLALRRLGKEVYLLNYNGQPHNLSNRAAARDFALRMEQFFERQGCGTSAQSRPGGTFCSTRKPIRLGVGRQLTCARF